MPESRRGTLEPLGFDATAVVIDRVIELEKSSSALIVGVRVKLTVRLFMLPATLGSPLVHVFFYSDPVPPPYLPQLCISGANPPPTLLYNHQ